MQKQMHTLAGSMNLNRTLQSLILHFAALFRLSGAWRGA
jgi:hypothetical protein